MKLKLDENLGTRGLEFLVSEGHDVCTVAIQSLTSASDEDLARRCEDEGLLDHGCCELGLGYAVGFQ